MDIMSLPISSSILIKAPLDILSKTDQMYMHRKSQDKGTLIPDDNETPGCTCENNHGVSYRVRVMVITWTLKT